MTANKNRFGFSASEENTLPSIAFAENSPQLPLFPVDLLASGDCAPPLVFIDRRSDDLVGMLKQANENLIRAAIESKELQKQAEISKKKQDEFLAMMAHELRNPLAPISSAAELLSMFADKPEFVLKAQNTIFRQTKHLKYLVDQLLDATRLASGNIDILIESVNFSSVVDALIETCQPLVSEKNQTVVIRDSTDGEIVFGDKVRLVQAFSNILDNASKYSEFGDNIYLEIYKSGRELFVKIRDVGIGMEIDLIPHIFEMFTQAPQGLARTKGGLGIGLSLTKKIIEKHRGTISATSSGPSNGSEFVVRLPLIE